MALMKEEGQKKLDRVLHIVMILLCLLFAAVNLVRCLSNNYWGDEAFTLNLARMSVPEMVAATAADVHPPLYYLIVIAFCRVFGYSALVYRGVSLIPYLIELILLLTVGWKRLGKEASIVLILFITFLKNAVNFNLQVRMYSWGALFVVLCYIALYEILTKNRLRDYAWFTLMGLCAAYTQYYCLISVAFFYAVMLLMGLICRKKYLKKALIASGITIAVYLPWLVVLLQTFARTSGSYWMTDIPGVKDCLLYLFSGTFRKVYLLCWALALAAAFLYGFIGLLKRKKPAEEPQAASDAEPVNRIPEHGKVTGYFMIWLAAGIFAVFGTAGVGIIVSKLVRPVFIVRYLYPVSQVAWLTLGAALSKLRGKPLYALVLTGLILVGSLPAFVRTLKTVYTKEQQLEETLSVTQNAMDENSVILTNKSHIEWTVAGIYYPGIPCEYLKMDTIPELEEGKDYWMFLSTAAATNVTDDMDAEAKAEAKEEYEQELVSRWETAGYTCEEILHTGNLGTYPICVYRVYPAD